MKSIKAGEVMKKTTSMILAIIMLISVFAPCQSIIAAEIERKSVSLFSSRIAKLDRKSVV